MRSASSSAARVVRVLPDEPAIDKTFDYLVPESLGDQVRVGVGTRVRIALGGRRVGGWVVEVDVSPPPGVEPRPLAKLSGHGPPASLIALAHWAAWRWAGRPASFLRTANPDRVVTALPSPAPPASPAAPTNAAPLAPLIAEALTVGEGRSVVRLAPAVDPYPLVRAATGLGNALVVCPTVAMARTVGMQLRRDGVGVAFHPRDWAAGAAGATVVGTRAAAWAPIADLAAVVVLDEHDESHAQEQAPTWHARDVVAERARRAGVPCVLVSPCPSLEALEWGRLLAPSRNDERAGWPIVDVVDRREDDPRTGLFSPRLVELLRSERRVVCVLNRTGRAKLLACAACGDLARCEACDAALVQESDSGVLACPRCGKTRPVVCGSCGGTRLKLLRQGVGRVREELEALVGEPVDEVSSLKDGAARPGSRVVVGTEAVLHQLERADVVAFLDLDQELLAPRYRAVEEALGLLARAARLVGGKAGGGRLLLQTRVPRHEVVQGVLQADPARVAEIEADRRELLRFPPTTAMAEVSGPAAEPYIAALRAYLADPTAPRSDPLPEPAQPTLDLWGTAPEPEPPPPAPATPLDLWATPSDLPQDPLDVAARAPGAPLDPWGTPPPTPTSPHTTPARPPDEMTPPAPERLGPAAPLDPWGPPLPAPGTISSPPGPAGVPHDAASPGPGRPAPGAPPEPWGTAPTTGTGPQGAVGSGEVEIMGPADGRWLVRAADHETLCDVLAAVARPPGRLRLAVDPLRV